MSSLRQAQHRPHLLCITNPELTATNRLFETACAARDIDFVPITAGRVGESGLADCHGPRLIYRVATDAASMHIERLLFGPEVAAVHNPLFTCDQPAIALLRAGLPVARKVFLPSLDPDERAGQVAWLGGYPLVVKMPDSQGGRGVHLAESEGALAELLRAAPAGVELEAFIQHDRAFRLLVIGGAVAACSAAAPGAGDFRSNSASARDLGPTPPPEGAVDIACRATAALRLDLGGVDILESLDGRLFVAEVNCPCYFAHQQAATGRDLAGAIVDHLLVKSRGMCR